MSEEGNISPGMRILMSINEGLRAENLTLRASLIAREAQVRELQDRLDEEREASIDF